MDTHIRLRGKAVDSTLDKINLPFVNVGPSLKQFSAFRWVFVLLTGFAVANVAARSVALTTTTLPNPFVAYANIFPGQPASTIEAGGFSCPSDYNGNQSPSGLYCSFTPADGVFSHVTVVIFGDKIHQISFMVRKSELTVGDLELIFETRAVHKFAHTAYFALPRQGNFAIVYTIGYGVQFSVFRPVRKISFTGDTLPSS
jgi:hypothetical protein